MASQHVTSVSDDRFDQEVKQSDRPVLVDFYTSWCPPCKAVAPVLEDLGAEQSDRLKIVKVDAEHNPRAATEHGVQSVPTFVLYDRGEPIAKTSGYRSKADFETWVDQSLAAKR